MTALGGAQPNVDLISTSFAASSEEVSAGQRLNTLITLNLQPPAYVPPIDIPDLHPDALHGIAGRIIRAIAPYTEASEAAMLFTLLTVFGNIVGRGPHVLLDGSQHPGRLFTTIVGQSARARKGTSWRRVQPLVSATDLFWSNNCISSAGLQSGEALVRRLRDPSLPDSKGEVDPGRVDDRLLVLESEFARLLITAGREGNTLSTKIRDAYDGNRLERETSTSEQYATNTHVSVLGQVTRDELLRNLSAVEVANGFANRFVYVLVSKSKQLPRASAVDSALLDDYAMQLRQLVAQGKGVGIMPFTADAGKLYDQAYYTWDQDDHSGVLGSMVARVDATVARLSVIYALLDGEAVVDAGHVNAALWAWDYCKQSVQAIWGDETTDDMATKLVDALKEVYPAGLTKTQENQGVFAGKADKTRLNKIRTKLLERGVIRQEKEESGGAPRFVHYWVPTVEDPEEEEASD